MGRSAASDKYKLAPPTKPEGLRIESFERGVAILGEVKPAGVDNVAREIDRGTLHGVYEFLERIVGYRFFIHVPKEPDLGIVTPVVKTLTVPADYKLELVPDFPYRDCAFETWIDRSGLHAGDARRRRRRLGHWLPRHQPHGPVLRPEVLP